VSPTEDLFAFACAPAGALVADGAIVISARSSAMIT
jgi:hypothetical protein